MSYINFFINFQPIKGAKVLRGWRRHFQIIPHHLRLTTRKGNHNDK